MARTTQDPGTRSETQMCRKNFRISGSYCMASVTIGVVVMADSRQKVQQFKFYVYNGGNRDLREISTQIFSEMEEKEDPGQLDGAGPECRSE
jgi:hypothetical protein